MRSSGGLARAAAVLLAIGAIATGLSLSAGCAGRRAGRPAPVAGPPAATMPSVSFAEFQTLPQSARRERVRLARPLVERARAIKAALDYIEQIRQRPWSVGFVPEPAGDIMEAIASLRSATGLDPSDAEAWCDLADLEAALGGADSARAFLERADVANAQRGRKEKDLSLRIALSSAWVCRELGRFRKGLAWAERAGRMDPADQEALLLRGLMLADTGDQTAAIQLAYTLEPVEYPDFGMFTMGLAKARSGYVGRWVEAMALLRAGDCEGAKRSAEWIDPTHSFLPHGRQYWNDMGMIHERCGEIARAGLYYAIAYLNAPYASFVPTEGFSRRPMVLGSPDVAAPCYVTHGGGYLAGSRFAFAADKVGRCVAATGNASNRACCDSALAALVWCARQEIDTTKVVALRGRVHFAQGSRYEAEEELAAAHYGFARAGLVDPETSLKLGQIYWLRGQGEKALPYFEEAAGTDTTRADVLAIAGAALLEARNTLRGRAALETALRTGGPSVPVLYNLGLLDVRESRLAEGIALLEQALTLAPQDRSVATLLEIARARLQAGQAATDEHH